MGKTALVGLLGATGALSRYAIGRSIGVRTFPWATLAINLTGCLALGFLLKLALDRGWSDHVVVPVSVGFLGAYTTFSTFSYETFTLARTDRIADAAVYVAVSLVGGVVAVALGYAIAAAAN